MYFMKFLNVSEHFSFLTLLSQCTLPLPPENIRKHCFQGVEKGCIGNKWVKKLDSQEPHGNILIRFKLREKLQIRHSRNNQLKLIA